MSSPTRTVVFVWVDCSFDDKRVGLIIYVVCNVTNPTFWKVSCSIKRKLCLFLGFERKLSFFFIIVMLSVKVTGAATFSDAHLCCVIALVDIWSYPSNTTVDLKYFLCMKVQYKSHTSL